MATTYHVSLPEPFNFSRPKEWEKWIWRFERFRKASGLEEKPEEAQVNTLIYSMGDEGDDILHSFRLTDEEKNRYSEVRARFDSHFVKRRNVIFERAKFNMRKQEDGEPVDSFITALYALAEHCGYGELHDQMIRDRIVVGLRDASLSEKLQLDAELTLETAVARVRHAKAVRSQQPLLRGEGAGKPETPLGAVHKGKGDRRGRPGGKRPRDKQPRPYWPKSSPVARDQSSNRQICSRCGKSPPHDRQQCPARDIECYKCSKRRHFQAVCRSQGKVGEVHQGEVQHCLTEDTQAEGDAFLGAIGEHGNPNNPWIVSLQLNSKAIHFRIDTGAEFTVISTRTHTGR